jgi:hypothetical protein
MEGVMDCLKVMLLQDVPTETEESKAECQPERQNQGPTDNETAFILRP